jgi:hypothetical protein
VEHYLENPEAARKIAMSGFHKAMRHHRWVNRVDYMLLTTAQLLDPAWQVRWSHGWKVGART